MNILQSGVVTHVARIVNAHTTPVNDFIVTLPIIDVTQILRVCHDELLLTTKQYMKIYDYVVNNYDFNIMTNEELLCDFASRCAHVFEDFDSFIATCDEQSIECIVIELIIARNEYNVMKSRASNDDEMREEFEYCPIVFV